MISTLNGSIFTSFIAVCAVASVVTNPAIWPFAAVIGLGLGSIALVVSNKSSDSGINTAQHWRITLIAFIVSVVAYIASAVLLGLQATPGITPFGLFAMFFFMIPMFFGVSYLVAAVLLTATKK